MKHVVPHQHRTLAPLLAACCIAVGCSSPPPSPSPPPDNATAEQAPEVTNLCLAPGKDLDAKICRLMSELRDAHGLPGLSAAIFESPATLSSYAIGEADLERSIAMTPRTRMLSGSIGKTFVAALALALLSEDKIDLDTPVAKWIGDEEWFQSIPHSESWTLRLLLKHRSGVQSHFDEEFARSVFPRFSDPSYEFDPIDLVRGLGAMDAGQEPGTQFAYTDTAFNIAAIVLSRVDGGDYFSSIKAAVAIQTNRVEPEFNLGLAILDVVDALAASRH